MERAILALIIIQIFYSCLAPKQTDSLNKSALQRKKANPVCGSGNILRKLKIGPLENYADLNAAWLDSNTIIIMADKYKIPIDEKGLPRPDTFDWTKAVYEFYKYTLDDDKLEKILEYPMGMDPGFLYLKILDDGTLAFKTGEKLVRYSIKKRKILLEYTYQHKYLDLALIDISPDGKKIAYFWFDKGAIAVIDYVDTSVGAIKTDKVPVSGIELLNYPMWSADSRYIMGYSPTSGDEVNSVTVIDTQNMVYKINRFKNHYSDNARVYRGSDPGTYIKYDIPGSGLITLEKYDVATGNAEKIHVASSIAKTSTASRNIDTGKSVMVISSIDFSKIDKPDGKVITSFIAYNYLTKRQCESEKLLGYSPGAVPLISQFEDAALVLICKIPKNPDEYPPWSIAVFDFSFIK
jgi:hypothetical protein